MSGMIRFMSVCRHVAVAGMVLVFFLSPPGLSAQGISLLRDTEIEDFLDDYSRPLMEVAGINPDSIDILLVNDQTLNAFAGGRYMGFNTGLFMIADTPNEIEAVIAHEVAHLAGGHSARRADAYSVASRPVIVSLVLAAGAIAAGAPDAGMGILGMGQTIGMANALSFTRGQESTADQASLAYLEKTGKSGRGAMDLWTKMRNAQIMRDQTIDPYLQTHPLPSSRLAALKERVEASAYFDVADSPGAIERLRLVQAKIRGFLDNPEDVLERYPADDSSDAALYARAIALYRRSETDVALAVVERLQKRYPENPFYYELKGQILFESGRIGESVAPHRRSVRLRPEVALFRINLARSLLETGSRTLIREAEGEFRRALLLEDDNSFAWFELARVYGALDNEAMADLAMAESRYHAGAEREANMFARRALAGLEQGSPARMQAAEIIRITQDGTGRKGTGTRGYGESYGMRVSSVHDCHIPERCSNAVSGALTGSR